MFYMVRFVSLSVFLLTLLLSQYGCVSETPNQNAKQDYKQLYVVADDEYANVRDELLYAIEDKGMVLSYRSHVNDMLRRTGKDLGYTDNVYSHGEILGFCKADLSNKVLRDNPHFINFCPYAITVYQIEGDSKVYLSHRTFPEQLLKNSNLKFVQALLQDLIQKTGAKPAAL